ncbi:hypothetical protein [Bacillus sp. RO1]|uniref:hypothetical protein n=1 Tax=Bacillus sp. RO1 TaxID=2722703 RepID=UPI00145645DA|nr:hypothetical protein [Bacillus sp. RO1]NLP51667.1 hypothetical protein [Bacillus sp. RO1]
MKYLLICLLAVTVVFAPLSSFSAATEQPKVAFTRYHSLWLFDGTKEVPLHENIEVGKFNWSNDGKWLVYEAKQVDLQTESEEYDIWLYNSETMSSSKLKIAGHDPQWNPVDRTFAFLTGSILCVVELTSGTPIIHQLTGGVSSFTWDAEGVNLIASASAALFPDGWSHPRLYEVHWGVEKEAHEMDVKVTPLHTVSSPLKYEDTSILAVDVEDYSWSHDGKNLAMVVTPTASWSADSNMLSVYVKENKLFIPLGEMLLDPNWIKWAPTKPFLASIQGGGRMTSGDVQNKILMTSTIIPNYKKAHTPQGFADVDFDWVDDENIVVARGRETSESSEKFVSSLYLVGLKEKEAVKISKTPEGYSDGEPVVLGEGSSLAWIREDADGRRHIWMSKVDGSDGRMLVENVFEVVWFGK